MIKFYNAGAGSGKTHTLSNDLAEFLIDKNGQPSQVILTTFSKKSAEELKERVRKTLLERGQPGKAAEMSNALIGTVNAVCSQLVEKYAMEVGLSPELRVLDEISTRIFFNEFINSSVDHETFLKLNRLSNRFTAFERDEEGAFKRKDNLKPDWPNMVKNLASRFRAFNFQKKDVERSKAEAISYAEEFLLTNPALSTSKIWAKIEETRDRVPEGDLAAKDNDAIDGLQKLRKLITNKQFATWADFANTGKEIAVKTSKNNEWFNEVVLLCRQYHRTPEFASEYIQFVQLIYDIAYELIDSYQAYKQERGLIDFADQELLFLNMLQKNEVVKNEIAATFKIVMVDEFQDSSPVQLAIFYRLKDLVANAVWVGDPKQSIYGFRDSDSELFNIALKSVDEKSIKPLSESYRSRPGIVHAVNSIFSGLFQGLLEDEHITLQPSGKVKEVEARPNGYSLPAIHIQFYDEKNLKDYYVAIGAYVKNVLKSGIKVYDVKGDNFRSIRGGDIALLFRTNPAIEEASTEFKLQGIEVSSEAEGLQQQAEVLWISCLLRLLINIHDPLAIANLAVLESAVENVEALLKARFLYEDDKNREEKWIEQSPVAQIISQQQQLLAQMPLVQAISHLVTASNLPLYCAQWGKASQRMSNIDKVLELSAAFEQQSKIAGLAATFSGFLDHLSNCFSLPPAESEDAVKLMTVHKAKGLEWPMVIAVKLDMPDDDCNVLFNTIHVKHPKEISHTNILSGQTIIYLPWPFGYSKKVEKVSQDLVQNHANLNNKLLAYTKFYREEDRLLYVALTRVRDYLVLPYYKKASGCCIESTTRSRPAGLFNAAHWEKLKGTARETPQTIELEGHKLMVQAFPPYNMAEEQIDEIKEVAFYNRGKRIADKTHDKRFISPSKAEKTEDDVQIRLLDYEQTLLPLNNLREDLYPTIGTAIHNAFASWKAEKLKDERTAIIQGVMHQMQLNGHVNADELDKRFQSFWEFIQQKYSPKSIVRELPLIAVTDFNGTITNGIADLVLQTNEGLVLIDHKTFPGHFESMALNPEHDHYAGKYARQLNLYKEMLEKSTGKLVVAMLLHYVVQGRVVEVS
ncbi:MAG: UvrD-helicase domain-containing protein [Segetibacter sp.]